MLELDIQFARGDFRLRAQQQLDGGISSVLGPSGSGKSTLLALIAGLLKPTAGTIYLDGQCLVDSARKLWLPSHQRHIGLVFQDRQLLPHLKVRDNLLYGYRQLQPAERRFQLNEVVELLELGALLERRPRQLSGGEQQRVALGRALLYAPRLLLLDEPLAALDERLKQQILVYLKCIHSEFKIPMLYVTHAPSEAEYLGGPRLLMKAGELTREAYAGGDLAVANRF